MGSTDLASFLVPAYLLVSLDTPGPVRPAAGPGVGTLAGDRPLAGALPRCHSDGLGYLTAPTFPSGCGPVLLVVERRADGVNCAESPLIRRP
jgi:hypothetical protein